MDSGRTDRNLSGWICYVALLEVHEGHELHAICSLRHFYETVNCILKSGTLKESFISRLSNNINLQYHNFVPHAWFRGSTEFGKQFCKA